MTKVAIIYDSATHNTEIMAKAIANGLESEGLDVMLTHVHEAKIEDILGIDGWSWVRERIIMKLCQLLSFY